MTDAELIAEAARRGYMLVPVPEVIDHDLRPGDRVVEKVPEAFARFATKMADKADARGIFDMSDQTGVVLAVASRADVLWKRDKDGRVIMAPARGLAGTPSLEKA